MSENTKKILSGIVLAVIMFVVVWVVWEFSVAILACALYFAGWLLNPPRFWKILGTVGLAILKFFGKIISRIFNKQ